MKLSDAQKLDLYRSAVIGLLSKPGPLPASTPPNREGVSKPVSPAFAVACWAAAIVRASVTVLDDDRAGGDDSTPFG